MIWRMIDHTINDAYVNMGIDEAISEDVGAGLSPPTIRFYGWRPSAVSIGYFQGIEQELDLAICAQNGVDVVRRRTGGGAVFHDSDGEITYSVIAREDVFSKDILESYRVICGWIIDSLDLIGITAEFKPINDITVNGKKISGNAQTRRGGVLLQHGTILYSVDIDRMFSLLRVPDEKLKGKMIASARDRVTSVSDESASTKDALYRALVAGFSRGKDIRFDALTDHERSLAEKLAETRYRKKEWNWMR